MKQELKGNIDTSKIKRCYLEGAELEVKCPNCGKMMNHDFGDQYLMYPQAGTIDNAFFVCDNCDPDLDGYSEFELPLSIVSTVMTIEYDLKELREL